MSETSKMGLFGSKEDNTNSNTGQLNKDESPERYAPYSVDSDSETYDTEALSIMDINDIIGVQTEPVGESTLESEIAALTEIITDSNIPEINPGNIVNKDTNQISAIANVNTSDDVKEKNDDFSNKIIGNKSTDNSRQSESSVKDLNIDEKKNINECTVASQLLENKEIKEANPSTCPKDPTAISKSLQLIGEAYDSDDSQESDLDEMQIGKEPKIIFSCKPLVDRQSCKQTKDDDGDDNCQTIESTIINEGVNNLTSIVEESIVVSVSNEKEKVEDNDDKPIEKSISDTVSEINECKNIDTSDEVKNTTDIVNDLAKVNEVSVEGVETMEEQKSPVNSVEVDSTPIIDENLSLPDNQSDDIEKKNDAIIEIEEKEKSIDEEINKMEVEVIEEESRDKSETCATSQPKEVESRDEIIEDELSQDVNKIIINDSPESEECPAVSVSEVAETPIIPQDVNKIDNDSPESEECPAASVAEAETLIPQDLNKIDNDSPESEERPAVSVGETAEIPVDKIESEIESNTPMIVTEKEEIKDDLMEINEVENCNKNSTEEIVEESCVSTDESIVTATIINEPEAVTSEEVEVKSPEIVKNNSELTEEVEAMEINTSETNDKPEVINENLVTDKDCPEKIEESIEIPSESEEKQITEEEKVDEIISENDQTEECADSSLEFVDALSPTHFPIQNIPEAVEEQEQEPQADVNDKEEEKKIDQEKEVSADETNKIEEVDDKENSDSVIPQDQTPNENLTEAIEISPDAESNNKSNTEPIEIEEKIGEIDSQSVAISVATEVTQQPEDLPDESSSKNSLESTSTPEDQQIPAQPSTDSELKATLDDANPTEPIKVPDININIEKIAETHVEEPEILTENHLPVPEPIENISNIIDNVPELKSILEDQEIQEEENITVPLSFSEEIASTASKVIDDIKQNLLSPDEFLGEALKNPIAQSDDSLDGILDLDLIPNIDDAEIKSNEPVENIAEDINIIEKEPALDILLEKSEIAAVTQAVDFLSHVIENLHESESETINTDVKNESESSTIPAISSMDKEEKKDEDAVELSKQEIPSDLPVDNDVEQPEIDMAFSLVQDEKLEIPDDILSDPLAVVNSSIEVLQANTEITELESAVKFLQESESHEIESPPILSPKMIDNIANEIDQRENPTIYSTNQEICEEDSSDLVTDLETITSESIAISEAEIINEAAKLESEKKFNEEANDTSTKLLKIVEVNKISDNNDNASDNQTVNETINVNVNDAIGIKIDDATIKATQSIFPVKSSIIPKTSILEERLKEPPKIEIPIVDTPRLCDMPTTPKTSLLIPRDSRFSNYQKMMESPKSSLDKSLRDDNKIRDDTTRKDSEKHDIENVGSPRIILKIAKSALADCAEPRSPKSPKIRSATNSPNPEDSPGQKLGKIKLKLSKSGHPSIIPNDNTEESSPIQWHTEGSSSLSPLGMKIKLSKSGDASIVQQDFKETPKHVFAGSPRRTESPLGMKIKLSKTGDASIIQSEKSEDEVNKETKIKEKTESTQDVIKRTDSPLGMKIKLLNTGDASIVSTEHDESKDPKIKEKSETHQDNQKRTDSHVGMKIKLSKKGGASIVPTNDNKDKTEMPNSPRRTESPLGMKIKLSKTGDASIIYSELIDEQISSGSHESIIKDGELMPGTPKRSESSIGMKIKLSKDGDATIVHSDKQEDEQQEIKRIDSPIGMKIKLSKSGDASIIQSQTETHEERSEIKVKFNDTSAVESMKIRLSKTGHGTIVANESDTSQRSKEFIEAHHIFSQKREQLVNRSEVTIEPIQLARRTEIPSDITAKRKDSVTLSPIETKKPKLDGKLSQILPEVTIQPVALREQIPINFEQSNSSAISRQQMNVINQEISITQLRPNKSSDLSVSEKLRKILTKPPKNSTGECEIIEHRPELIIVNENSNSSQDIMIIDEVPALRIPEVKTPKKRGRPRRNPIAVQFPQPNSQIPSDPLALDDVPSQLLNNSVEPKENERPRRTCRSQKSYAPPRRGRGRGRGKRKFDKIESPIGKKPRLNPSLTSMDDHSTALITLDDEATDEVPNESSELYKALRQPLKAPRMDLLTQNPVACTVALNKNRVDALIEPRLMTQLETHDTESVQLKTNQVQLISDHLKKDTKDTFGAPDHQNWLTPSSKKYVEINRSDGLSTVQVIDEETRMSAESSSRSQTPARNMSANAAETIINEESQGSVLSTATTESEKVKVRNRRMEISFDPDEGPFTVDKIAEYEWPIDRKGETFMIQEQISQYLGVKSFKRKYPDLKRRMVDMEERNYLRENCLVSEAMCDMGLTAIYSSEVLDIMCSDFPDQYEEYRKHMREKQIKEHSKKQKELSAAATAEKNRIDLAEMAVQSALSWNVNLNKARRESRRCSLDLQTFTIHVPKKLQKIEKESKVSHYPVALIPGQYTDYYREYTPAELRYYPLNTVLYGPMRPNERKFDSQSEGSPSDSDSDSSSDDSSCSSSEGTQDTEESQSTMDDVDIELSNQKDKSLKCKMCLKNLNKSSKSEALIQCGTCSGHVHPSCIDLTLDMVPHIQAYAWQCTDCKTCVQCHDPADEDKMLFCDMCDRGYHIYCVGLRRVPQGRWHCQECAICASCGSREAGGINADRNSVALWQHEYKKGDKNTRVYVSTLCVPCSKLWRKGRYCPHCSRCHSVPRLDTDENLVHCSACDKYLHLECVENKVLIIDRKNYQCDLCIQNRQRIVKPSVSKVIRA